MSMYIGVLQFTMEIPHADSLKAKRSVIKSLKDRVRRFYNVSISEVADHDVHTEATLAAVMAGTDVSYINSALDKLLNTLDEWRDAVLADHQLEIIRPSGADPL